MWFLTFYSPPGRLLVRPLLSPFVNYLTFRHLPFG